MAKRALLLLLSLLLISGSANADEIKMLDIGTDIETNLRREMHNYSWLEFYNMSENDHASTSAEENNILGRSAAAKFRSIPDPFQHAFYLSYAKYLNTALDNIGMRSFLKKYEEWTKTDIRFNVSESWKSVIVSQQSVQRDVYFETRATMQVSESGDSHVGLKFDPQGLDLERIQNFTAFAEHSSELGRLELRYASFSKLSVLVGKNALFSIPTLDLTGEYKALDKRAYLGASYRLDHDWRAKISGAYGIENRDQSVILIFYRSLN